MLNTSLLGESAANGVKFTPENVIATTSVTDPCSGLGYKKNRLQYTINAKTNVGSLCLFLTLKSGGTRPPGLLLRKDRH